MSATPAPAAAFREDLVRQSLRFGPGHAIRRWWKTRGLGRLGRRVHVGRAVQFLRNPAGISLGDGCIVKDYAILCPTNPEATIAVGEGTSIGYFSLLFAATRIQIGRQCLIAPFCYVVDNHHNFARGRPIREQGLTSAPIRIGDDVWLGAGVQVAAGVTIGEGAVIGAGSFVNADVPPYAVAVGTPARVIKERA